MSLSIRRIAAEGHPDLLEVTLSNDVLTVRLLSLGATLWSLEPVGGPGGDQGAGSSLCLALPSAADYITNEFYLGVTAGPVANRISGSSFAVDGQRFDVEPNEGLNQLHGGPRGFSRQVWDVDGSSGEDAARFLLHRPDGQGGYPGNLDVSVTYRLDDNRLGYEWTAVADAPTPVSLTNHAYWNLSGVGSANSTIARHALMVPAGQLVEIDDASLPTGRLSPVGRTPLDLRRPQNLGWVMGQLDGDGIDHCYVLDPEPRQPITLFETESGRQLRITTTLPGVQVYTGQHLDGTVRAGGHPRHSGICLETQFLPDSPNRPEFPSCLLRPGQPVVHSTDYYFDLERGF